MQPLARFFDLIDHPIDVAGRDYGNVAGEGQIPANQALGLLDGRGLVFAAVGIEELCERCRERYALGLGVLAKLFAGEDVARFLAGDGEGEKLRMVAAERDQTARVAYLQNE